MRKTLVCLVLLAAVLATPIFAQKADSIFKSQQKDFGINVFAGGGYGVDAGAEMILYRFTVADVLPLDIGAVAWGDFGFFGNMGLGIGAGVSAHLGFNIPFAFVTGEEFRMAYGLGVGIPLFYYSTLSFGFAYMEDFIFYTNFLPANMGIRLGWTSAGYASGGGVGLNIKL